MKSAPKTGARAQELSVVTQPTDFFKQQVTKALENQSIKIDPHTEYYLVDLLNRFMLTKNLFAVGENGALREEVLALLFTEALSAVDRGRKHEGLRRLGDISLYTAGFFPDRLSRKVVDIDYYIGMGRSAYSTLATSGFDVFFQKVFVELSERFHKLVDVLGEVSESAGTKDAKNLLRLYETWLKTRSERAEKSLKEAGIVPNVLIKPDWQ